MEMFDKIIASVLWLVSGIFLTVFIISLLTDMRFIYKTMYDSWRNPKYSVFYQLARGCTMPFLLALILFAFGMTYTFNAIIALQLISTAIIAFSYFLRR